MTNEPEAALSSGVAAILDGYRRGAWSVTDIITCMAARLEALDPLIGAFTATDIPSALGTASAMDARLRARPDQLPPLFGIPVAVKETIDVAGLPTSWGLEALRRRRPARDALVVARLRAAGAIVAGATRSPALAWSLSTEGSLVVGRTANPRHPDRLAGGSSGGSAAAVASGMVPIALGSDTGGSIRLPAGWCGVMGHRPTQGLVPTVGVVPLSPGLDAVGPIASTVADLATAMSVLCDRDMTAPADALPKGSIGFCYEGLDDAPAALDALHRVRAVVQAVGVRTRDVPQPWANASVIAAYTTIQLHEAWTSHRADEVLGTLTAEEVPAGIRRRWERGASTKLDILQQARAAVAELGRELHGYLQEVSLIVSPVASGPPPATADVRTRDGTGLVARAVLPHTIVQNLLGLPSCAFSVPHTEGPPVLPVALQVTGPRGADEAVLRFVAMVVEHLSAESSHP